MTTWSVSELASHAAHEIAVWLVESEDGQQLLRLLAARLDETTDGHASTSTE
jgi:hypothetical protein